MSGTHRPVRTVTHSVCAVLLTLLAQVPAGASAGPGGAGADTVWTRSAVRPDDTAPRTVSPRVYAAYALDRTGLLEQLASGQVEVPDPTGRLVAFRVAPTSVMEPELAAAHPELRTWAGTAVEGAATIRIDSTPAGVHASVHGDGPAWYVDPAYRGDDSLYLSYAGADLPAPERGLVEPALPQRTKAQLAADAHSASLGEGPGATVTLRTYRLALLSDPTYAAFVAPGAASNGASDTAVLAAKVTLVNRLDQLYGDDLSIRLQLVTGTDTKLNLWTAAEASGPNGPCGQFPCFPSSLLAAGCTLPLLDLQRWVVGHLVGARNYDVGHFVLGIDGGGIAYLDTVGRDTKAGGCTGLSAPSGDAYTVDYLAHELGHQFGADHTFDGSASNCSGQRAPDSAVEPGSGSTIMGYAGICGADNLQAHSDPVFSTVSRDAIDNVVRADAFAVMEWQSVAFSQLDGTDSFKLQFGGNQTSTLTRGSTYNAANLRSAILAALPGGTILQVKPFFNDGSFDDRGFSLFFTAYGGAFAGNVPEPTVVPVSGSFTSSVNDIDAGNPDATAGGATTTTGNHNPTVTAPADRTIPVRTPFALTGSATDSDGNALGYVWEQTDMSGSGSGLGLPTEPKTAGPLFRVFGTASSTFANTPSGGGATRSFPDLAQVIAGNTNAVTGTCPAGTGRVDCLSEWLPTAAYTGSALHFRLTARDASAQGGGLASDDVTLTLDKTRGPFRVTSQAAGGTTLAGGSSSTVAWTTGTSTLAPAVKVSLSTNGGASFPTVLLASTPNDGSQAVTLPDLNVAAARLKVEAVGNYFYDVNDASFAIQATGSPPPLVVNRASVPATMNVQLTDAVSATFSASTGQGAGALSASATGLPAGVTLSAKNVTSPSAASWSISGTPTAAPGSHPVHVSVTDGVSTAGFDVTVVVAAEGSTVAYTGPTSVVGPDPDADEVPVTMTARVTQAADGSLGPINLATVRFRDTRSGATLCAAAPVATSGTGPGTASCVVAADLSAVRSVTYRVALTVGGSYVGGSTTDTTVTVSLPEEPQPVPPDTTITSGPTGWLLGISGTFGFASTVPGSTFVCRLDGVSVPCTGSSATVNGLSQRTHRFTVAARDPDGLGDVTPAARDFAVPVDDAGLRTSGRWQRKRNGASYLGTYSQARKKGVALTYKVSDVRELALLVRTGKGYGAVKVFLGGTLLSTVRTGGRAGSKVVRVGHFAGSKSGTVRIVTTSGRTVRIDGLGVSTTAF